MERLVSATSPGNLEFYGGVLVAAGIAYLAYSACKWASGGQAPAEQQKEPFAPHGVSVHAVEPGEAAAFFEEHPDALPPRAFMRLAMAHGCPPEGLSRLAAAVSLVKKRDRNAKVLITVRAPEEGGEK